jgi:hypothetical protein
MKITITCKQYLTIKALFNAASSDYSLLALTRVCYQKEHKRLVATNGHILRVESVDFEDASINGNLLFEKKDFPLTSKNFKDLHGKNYEGAEVIVDCEAETGYNTYPNIASFIPDFEKEIKYEAQEFISINFDLLTDFKASFAFPPKQFAFQFGFKSNLGAITTFVSNKFAGVVMPFKIYDTDMFNPAKKEEKEEVIA